MDKKMCYFVSNYIRDKDTKEIIPVVIKDGVKGYFMTDLRWGHDLEDAEKKTNQINAQLGLTEDETIQLIANSMKKD